MNDSKSAKPERRWCQFSLRTLCLFAMVVSIGASVLGVKIKQERERREAITAIEKLGGCALGEGTVDPRRFGQPVVAVFLFRCGRVTDADLEHVKRFTQLQELYLSDTGVTDAGLEHLEGLTQIHTLILTDTGVTDAGLEHLKGLTQLQVLDLSGTKVTAAGLEHLKGLTQLQQLGLNRTGITDAGLEHFKSLTQLEWLNLTYVNVTDAGLKKLKRALPNCRIQHVPVPATKNASPVDN